PAVICNAATPAVTSDTARLPSPTTPQRPTWYARRYPQHDTPSATRDTATPAVIRNPAPSTL
ncbi:MAG: tonB-system energizer ExbB, partial [Clostridia bacterium]